MSYQLIDGKAISTQIKSELREENYSFINETGVTPHLVVIIVGDNQASQTYVRGKQRACEAVGIKSTLTSLDASISEEELLEYIEQYNNDENVHGLLVQLPLPKHIDEQKIINSIKVEKDVDGFHPINVGRLVTNQESLVPCTPLGIIKLIKSTGVDLTGKNAVIVGRSNIVGKPVAHLLLKENATVTISHSRTKDLAAVTNEADILVAAVGRKHFVTKDMVKPGAIVIDVGINRNDEGKLCGDVDFDAVKEVAGHITPVPKGVGPMTITMLLNNTLQAAKSMQKNK